MKNARLALTIIALVALSQVAMAQTSGIITLNATVPDAFSFTNTSNGSIGTVTVNLGSLAVPLSPAMVTDASTILRLRSNKAYKVMAAASAPGAPSGTPDGGDTMLLKDIGFGITAIGNNGTGNLATGQTNTIATNQDYTGGNWPPAVPADGLTPFGAVANKGSLNEVASSTQILSGSRISKRGNVVTTDNYITITLGFAVLPQYFTPDTGFTTNVTLTMSLP
jgi:hypothetical protein